MHSYIMHESFIDSISELVENDQLELFWAITDYALYDEEPKLDGALKALFAGMRRRIDTDKRRYQARRDSSRREERGA